MTRFANGWLAQRDIRTGAKMRLFCLPHAGSGAAAFYAWKRKLPATIDVCPILLPGREARLFEDPMDDAVETARRVMESTGEYLDVPYAIFGHSMGSLLAYLWAANLASAKAPAPMCLFVSGREGAQIPLHREDFHALDDDGFVAELQARYGGTPGELLANPELRAVFLPILRADIRLVERYRYRPQPLLQCSVVALAGTADPNVTPEGLEAWGALTSGEFAARRLPGDHFYHVGEGEPELLKLLAERLG